jgi:hypothetical protein
VFARKIRIEVASLEGGCACRLAWLDSFCMRSFTGRGAFDETLPVADGLVEVSFQVDVEQLRAEMEDWLTRKFGAGTPIKLILTELGTP